MEKRKILMFLLVTGLLTCLQAEEFREEEGWKLGHVSLTAGGTSNEYLAAKFNFSMIRSDGFTAGVRLLGASEFNFFGPTPSEGFSEAGFLMGRSLPFRWIHLHAAAGVSYCTWIRRGRLLESGEGMFDSDTYEKISFNGVGLPFELSMIPNLKYVGVGVTLFGNINMVDPVMGFGFTAGIGKFFSDKPAGTNRGIERARRSAW